MRAFEERSGSAKRSAVRSCSQVWVWRPSPKVALCQVPPDQHSTAVYSALHTNKAVGATEGWQTTPTRPIFTGSVRKASPPHHDKVRTHPSKVTLAHSPVTPGPLMPCENIRKQCLPPPECMYSVQPQTPSMASATVLIPAGDLRAYTAACLIAAGSLKENAELVAEVSGVQ